MSEINRCVLAGAPRVGFYNGQGAPEDDLLPSCIKAFLRMRGEDLGFTSVPGNRDPWHQVHCYLMGTSGLAFRMAWNRSNWDMGDGSPFRCTQDAMAPARMALRSAGYGCETSLKPGFAEEHGQPAGTDCSESGWRRRIVESIRDKGRPVIALGVIGPPEPCLVTGFEEDGALLIGWNAFQGDGPPEDGIAFEPTGEFRARDWYDNTEGLIFIGDPIPRPDDDLLDADALNLGLQVMQTPSVRGRATGLAAFSAWADDLLADPFLPGLSADAIHQHFEVHHQRGGDLAEARAWGGCFLTDMIERHPELRDDLQAAIGCFNDEHDLVWAMWEFMSGMSKTEQGQDRFSNPHIRGRMAPLVRLMRTRDAQAMVHLQAAERRLRHQVHLRDSGNRPPNPPATIRREGDRMWLEGSPVLEWYAGHDCTFIGSLAAALSMTERPVPYTTMLAATGLAFRTRWSNPDTIAGWDRSCVCGEYMEEWDDVQRATGWDLYAEFPGVTQDPPDDPNVQRVMRDLEAGRPVMAGVDGPDIGLIVGYADNGRRMLVRKYGDGPDLREVSAEAALGGFQLRLGLLNDVPDRRSVLAAALRTAIRNRGREKTSAGYEAHGKEFLYGSRAMKGWADDLLSRGSSPDLAAFHGLNRFAYLSLLDARKAAAAYLRAEAAQEPGDIGQALAAAADCYAREVELLQVPVVAGAGWLAPDRPAAEWTAEERAGESEILRAAEAIEVEATRHLAAAAHAMETVPPARCGHDGGHWAILPGVPRAGYDVHLCPLPGSLFSALSYLGDDPCYDDLMGFTGACFRRFWEKDDGGNVDLMYLGEEPVRRASLALGRDLLLVERPGPDELVTVIKQSLWEGRPVVGFGIIGPPEACVISGYDRGGAVLMGWSYFQDPSLPGLFQRSDWFARASWPGGRKCVVTIGDRRRWPGPSRRDLLEYSLEWAVDLGRTSARPEVPGHAAGLAACAAWADALEVDEDYPADDPDVMGTRLMVHGDQCVMQMERSHAARFLRRMLGVAPEAEGLLSRAADLYDQVAACETYPWGCDMGPIAHDGLADAATRRGIAAEVRKSLVAEGEAIALLEEALAAIKA